MDELSEHIHSFYYANFTLNRNSSRFLKVYILADGNHFHAYQIINSVNEIFLGIQIL